MAKGITILAAALAVVIAGAEPIRFDLSTPPSELHPLLASLESGRPVKSEFTEIRSNPFQKRPRRFEGMILWHPDYGLSLQYSSPGSSRIDMNADGITIYRKGDEPRHMDISQNDPGMAVFLKLFAWDTDWIRKHFETLAELEDESWRIQLKPSGEETSGNFSRIELHGTNSLLKSIHLDLAGGREIGITLNNQEVPWNPDQAALETQFQVEDVRE